MKQQITISTSPERAHRSAHDKKVNEVLAQWGDKVLQVENLMEGGWLTVVTVETDQPFDLAVKITAFDLFIADLQVTSDEAPIDTKITDNKVIAKLFKQGNECHSRTLELIADRHDACFNKPFLSGEKFNALRFYLHRNMVKGK